MSKKQIIKKNIYNIKIILLGETGVGKTNLINSYFGSPFYKEMLPSMAPNQSHEKLEINNNICYIDIWDTMGQEVYRSITQSYIKGSHIIIFVYDITSIYTFKELKFWVAKAKEEVDNEKIIFGLCANKMDLFEECQVDKKEGENYAKEISAIFCETSAKENKKGFQNFILKLVEKLLINENSIKKEGNIIENSNIFDLNKEKKENPKPKKNCC